MATLTEQGNVTARCAGCDGAVSTFEYRHAKGEYGAIVVRSEFDTHWRETRHVFHLLFKCAGCGRGASATIDCIGAYPGKRRELLDFRFESGEVLKLPKEVPKGIFREFREAEKCLANACFRASAGLFRSVLDKTLRANGYKLKPGTNLEQQIDLAAQDGILTESRRRRAHDEVRVLGNDVLHDEWHPIAKEDVEAAQHYLQRILEDFYDDRPATLTVLRSKGRTPDEDKAAPAP